MKREWFEANRALWDERVPIHARSEFYGVREFKAGARQLLPFEREHVGDVRGKSLVHLQCHFGLDTLDWTREGARVTGLDLSPVGVQQARVLAAELGLPARFEVANVYDAPRVLGEHYDVVYTGQGALCWLPDLSRWAEVVRDLLVPGGFVYLTEFHPITDSMTWTTLDFERDYFASPEPVVYVDEDDGRTYVETDETTASTRSFEWQHPVSDVVSSLLAAGLRLELFEEHAFTVYKRFPFLEREGDGFPRVYRMPAGRPSLPLMYSLRARKPAS